MEREQVAHDPDSVRNDPRRNSPAVSRNGGAVLLKPTTSCLHLDDSPMALNQFFMAVSQL
jgi:hypothetical protein